MAKVCTALPAAFLPAFCAFWMASCATDLGIEKRDGWPDAPPDEGEVDSTDVPVEDGPLPDCGNGTIDDGEECDGDLPRDCTTSCDSTGIETCVECSWSECVPPCETCSGADDDCDDMIDESGRFTTATTVRVTEDDAPSTQASLAWTDTEFGLVWVDERGGQQDLYSAIVAADASIPFGEDLFVSADTSTLAPAMVWANDVFNVVATDETGGAGRHVLFQRMDGVGDTTGPVRTAGSIPSTDLRAPSIVERTGGGGFAVTWDSSFDIHLVLTNLLGNPTSGPFDLVTDGNVSRDAHLASRHPLRGGVGGRARRQPRDLRGRGGLVRRVG
ncbi:MAG: hypothetical protein JRG91_02000 [Deltaproteobacteria bacterium]|nr:hypothetical protein [Deltaproteobacteria bacterium]